MGANRKAPPQGPVGQRIAPQARPLQRMQGLAPWLSQTQSQFTPRPRPQPAAPVQSAQPWYAPQMEQQQATNAAQVQALQQQQALAAQLRAQQAAAVPPPDMSGLDGRVRGTGRIRGDTD